MEISKGTLEDAWGRTAAGHALLHGVGLPQVVLSEEELDEWEGWDGAEGEGLALVLDEDGTVHGYHGAYRESFVTRDLEQVLYLIAEAAIRERGGSPAETAEALGRIDPLWGRRFRTGGLDGTGVVEACGRDPLEGFAWIADSWREQIPYTTLAFFRAEPGRTVDASQLALLYGADPGQVAAGTRLKDLRAGDGGRAHWDRQWDSFCFGQSGEWAFLLYHDTPPKARANRAAYDGLGVGEGVWLTATLGKAIYTFSYVKDGQSVNDDIGALELLAYDHGRSPYLRGGKLDFLNRALRRAELDHPELTNTYQLYFHALEESLGLGLPRREFAEGEVRAGYWTGK
ncbi:hypothetical protein GCM10010387_13530 [Streptomyces inusitatus]|uniref:Uncharacterized protein n=1 Tax=Streptomyces inusitatus TaxID=68221 RepID=A0A918PT05_9ACTN|nr:hypothetical protein [Streptomyces inusitatus]GGZ21695.1 hypothetical protein GCM10010387_13530 [Streptomyces inusitatus]